MKVLKLQGGVTEYFIAADGHGNALLYRTISANGAVDLGGVASGSTILPITGDMRRAARQQYGTVLMPE